MDPLKWILGLAAGRLNWPVWKTPGSHGLAYEDVVFPSAHPDRVALSGWLVPCANPRGVVLLCHGIGSTRFMLLKQALMLHRHGWASLLFDFRARGRSGGSRCTFGQRELEDVKGAVVFLKSRPELAGLPLVAIGQSLGAAALLLAMAEEPRIQAAVVEACFARLIEAVKVRCCILGPWAGTGAERIGRLLLSEHGVDVARVAPVDYIASLSPRPVLIVHDRLDFTIGRGVSQELYERAGQPKQLWVAPWSPHVQAATFASAAYEEQVCRFLESSLVSAPTRASF